MERTTTPSSLDMHSEQMFAGSVEPEIGQSRQDSRQAQPFLLKNDNAPAGSSQCPVVEFVHSEERDLKSIRMLDVSAALLLLFFLLPLMMLCALAVKLSGPGPVLFRQSRIGRDGRNFTCLKLRTMTVCAQEDIARLLEENGSSREEWSAVQKLRCDPRVTPVGAILRKYCLDELPQLINVLRGEMSVVGPRPIIADEIQRYGSHFSDYCKVKPGLTGLWQVSGMHSLSYEERVAIDVAYANAKSLGLDIKILMRTVPVVLLGKNY